MGFFKRKKTKRINGIPEKYFDGVHMPHLEWAKAFYNESEIPNEIAGAIKPQMQIECKKWISCHG